MMSGRSNAEGESKLYAARQQGVDTLMRSTAQHGPAGGQGDGELLVRAGGGGADSHQAMRRQYPSHRLFHWESLVIERQL